MADQKSTVSRRTTRIFENDVALNDVAAVMNRTTAKSITKKGDYKTEKLQTEVQDREKSESPSYTSATPSPARSEDELDGLQGLKDEIVREVGSVSEFSEQSERSDIPLAPRAPGQPRNFGMVIPGVYRSAYPETEDHEYLKELGLRTIVTLVDKDYPEGYQDFMQSSGIRHVVIKMAGTKKADIPHHIMNTVLDIVLDPQSQPVLLHCNQGRHRTGCTVAVIRKVMGWSHDSIISEYSAYAHPKVRETDIKYIDGFDPANVSVSVDTLHWRAGKSKTPRSLSDIRKWIKFIAFVLAMACLWGLTYSDLRLVR